MTASVTAIASWYGSNRTLAAEVGRELRECAWVGVPFAGGMSELFHIHARTLRINDLHRHVINLAAVAADPRLGPALYRRLRRQSYSLDTLRVAQDRCRQRENLCDDPDSLFAGGFEDPRFARPRGKDGKHLDLDWAVDYFLCAWMSRHGTAGQAQEFDAGLGLRWEAGGGDNAVHYRNATKALIGFRRMIRDRADFSTLDFRDFLGKCHDRPDCGIYNDPPFYGGPGDLYKHSFSLSDHRDLAGQLESFEHATIVCRFYDTPTMRQLYPSDRWIWRGLDGGRDQHNQSKLEVLAIHNRKGASR